MACSRGPFFIQETRCEALRASAHERRAKPEKRETLVASRDEIGTTWRLGWRRFSGVLLLNGPAAAGGVGIGCRLGCPCVQYCFMPMLSGTALVWACDEQQRSSWKQPNQVNEIAIFGMALSRHCCCCCAAGIAFQLPLLQQVSRGGRPLQPF